MRKLPTPTNGRLLKKHKQISRNIALLLLFLFTLLTNPVLAAEGLIAVDVSAMPATTAFEAFRTQTGFNVEWSADEVTGVTSKAVSGNMSAQQAIEAMLAGSGLQATLIDGKTFVISPEIDLSRTTRLSQAEAGTETDEMVLEEVVVTGTQIKGAAISEALSVSVISSEDIEAFGISSGDELLQTMTEQGQNFQSESENTIPGVNSVRGDIGAFNLRNMGTGNTLVLLNGRRMVQAAGYQTEEVGGSFVPVNSVNPNEIPVMGVRRVEVLRDGASAIYGADAVAGVVNTVLKNNVDGLTVRARYDWYDNIPRNDIRLNIEWGKDFNQGRTNISVFADYYHRDRVSAQDDPRWANADLRWRLPEDSPWLVNPDGSPNNAFRSDTNDSLFGQFDMAGSVSGVTDSAGEFETWPIDDPNCQRPQAWYINEAMCGLPDGVGKLEDGQNGPYRYNSNEYRDLASDLDRYNVFVYLNHEFNNGVEAYTEFSYYKAKTNLSRQGSTWTGTLSLTGVGAQNYYNPFGPCGSPNRLPPEIIGEDFTCDGKVLVMDTYGWEELPRIIDNTATTWRALQGFRGAWGDWDWDGAVVWSKAKRDDITHNRISNTLMTEALNDPTAAAYNPFNGGILTSNIERALIDVYRKNKTDLKMADFKISKNDLFNLPAGPVGFLAGTEWREESFDDDRDPRLDGTITYTSPSGETFPYISDVMNSSPTIDSHGSRKTTSLFAELAVPVFSTLDMQFAARYEHASDYGSYTVPKAAFGWRIFEPLLIRGSWSKAFRAPNLITVNEDLILRNNTVTNQVCAYAEDFGGVGAEDQLVCSGSVQRRAAGNQDLEPEKSTNTSIGAVWEPLDNLMITLDFWSIKKKDTIGLFGEENATLLDLLLRLEAGTANCDSFVGNPAIGYGEVNPDDEDYYLTAGVCPIGDTIYVEDNYQNLDTRTIKGHDIGVYYSLDTSFGDWDFTARGTFYDKYEQEAGGAAALLIEAGEAGILPPGYFPEGFDDLLRQDGNQRNKYNFSLAWRKDAWGVNLSAFYLSSFIWTNSTLSDGTKWVVPSMTTYNANIDYRFDMWKSDTRLRFGINNFTDKRAPLVDRYYGYAGDAHTDYGRYFYIDLRMGF